MARSVEPMPDSKERWALAECLGDGHCALHPQRKVGRAFCTRRELHADHDSPHPSVRHCLSRQMLLFSDVSLLHVQVLGPTSDEDTMLLRAADEQNAAAGLGPGGEGSSKGQGEV